MNRGLAESRGRAVALMVDGAHVLTPGVLRHGLAGLEAYDPAIVATQAWYVGPGQQGDVMRAGYDQAVEDALFKQIGWPATATGCSRSATSPGTATGSTDCGRATASSCPAACWNRSAGSTRPSPWRAAATATSTSTSAWRRRRGCGWSILGEGRSTSCTAAPTNPTPWSAAPASAATSTTTRAGPWPPVHGPEKPIHYVGGFTTEAAKRSGPGG